MANGDRKLIKRRKPGKFSTRKFLDQEKFELYRFYRKYVIYKISNLSKNIKKGELCWLCPKDCECTWKSTSKFSFFAHVRMLEKKMHKQLIFEIGERQKKEKCTNKHGQVKSTSVQKRLKSGIKKADNSDSQHNAIRKMELIVPRTKSSKIASNLMEEVHLNKIRPDESMNYCLQEKFEQVQTNVEYEKENLYQLNERESSQLTIDLKLMSNSPNFRQTDNWIVYEEMEIITELMVGERNQSMSTVDQNMTNDDDQSMDILNEDLSVGDEHSLEKDNQILEKSEIRDDEQNLKNELEQNRLEQHSLTQQTELERSHCIKLHIDTNIEKSIEKNDRNDFESDWKVVKPDVSNEIVSNIDNQIEYLADDEKSCTELINHHQIDTIDHEQTTAKARTPSAANQSMANNFVDHNIDTESNITIQDYEQGALRSELFQEQNCQQDQTIRSMKKSKSQTKKKIPIYPHKFTMFNLFNRLISRLFK